MPVRGSRRGWQRCGRRATGCYVCSARSRLNYAPTASQNSAPQARAKELKNELLNSQRLAAFFEEHPQGAPCAVLRCTVLRRTCAVAGLRGRASMGGGGPRVCRAAPTSSLSRSIIHSLCQPLPPHHQTSTCFATASRWQPAARRRRRRTSSTCPPTCGTPPCRARALWGTAVSHCWGRREREGFHAGACRQS